MVGDVLHGVGRGEHFAVLERLEAPRVVGQGVNKADVGLGVGAQDFSDDALHGLAHRFFRRFYLIRQICPCVNGKGNADCRQNQNADQPDFYNDCFTAEYQFSHHLSACFREKRFYKPQNRDTSFAYKSVNGNNR